MHPTTHEEIRHRCFKATLLGFRFTTQPILQFTAGRYDLRDGQLLLHPLEYFALCAEPPLTGDLNTDLKHILGVSPEWISGFMSGFGGDRAALDNTDYGEGCRCGQAVMEDLRRLKR